MKNNLFLVVGEDNKLITFNLFKILNNINYDENNKIIYDMNNGNFVSVLDEASTISLFSSVKVIIVDNFDIDKLDDNEVNYLERYIKGNNKDVYFILIASKIDSRKKNYKIFKENFTVINVSNLDNNNDIYDYVIDVVNDKKYKMDRINIELFINKVGNDINNINNELNKLFTYKSDSKIISREDIDLLISDNIDNVIYEFTNAIIDNDYDKIKIMYDKFMLDNISIDYLITSVFGNFRACLIVKILNNKNMSNFDIAKIINKKEFYVKKTLDRLYGYTVDDLKKYINKLAMIDRNLKSGKDNVGKFELFLFDKEN